MTSRTNSARLITVENDVLAQLPAPEVSVKAAEPSKTQAQLLFQGQLNPAKQPKIVRLEQWVEIAVRHGKTITKQFPNNRELIRRGQQMWPAPKFVYRRLNFPQRCSQRICLDLHGACPKCAKTAAVASSA